MSDVVEAMARGMWEASEMATQVPYGWDGLSETTRERMRGHIRAAIRAVEASGGLVVGKMPGDVTHLFGPPGEKQRAEGWNLALAAVRANAVRVDHIPEVSKMVIAEPPHE